MEKDVKDGLMFGWKKFNAGIDFLEFKPSVIAAAVAISFAVKTETVDSEKALSALVHHVQKVNMVVQNSLVQSRSFPC